MKAYIHELVTFSNLLFNHDGLSPSKKETGCDDRAATTSILVYKVVNYSSVMSTSECS